MIPAVIMVPARDDNYNCKRKTATQCLFGGDCSFHARKSDRKVISYQLAACHGKTLKNLWYMLQSMLVLFTLVHH